MQSAGGWIDIRALQSVPKLSQRKQQPKGNIIGISTQEFIPQAKSGRSSIRTIFAAPPIRILRPMAGLAPIASIDASDDILDAAVQRLPIPGVS
jgi:hypothetical protein